jgi:RNA polymerase sigma-70 factor (ECF subfamily)
MSLPGTPLADILERDRQILQRIGQPGDAGTAAVAELYDAYGRLVFSLIVKMVGVPTVAEELVQDVFVRVWRSAPTYQPELGSVRAWLLAIAHHRAVDELRRWRKERDWISLEKANPDGLGTVEDTLGDPLVSRAMATLPPEQFQVIQLAYFHGLSGPEIAARLNLPAGTVKSRIRLALEKLRSALGVDKDGPP